MKTILVLTDFSENAGHAAKTIAGFAKSLSADILLYNTYYDHPILPDYSGGPSVAEAFVLSKSKSTAQLNELTNQLTQVIAESSGDGFSPQIRFLCGEGALGKNIEAVIPENDVELVVIGNSTDSTIDHLIFGSDTMDVLDHSPCPVLIIPPKAEMRHLKKVTLATAFELSAINAINYLGNLGQKLNFELEVVHVSVFEEKDDPVKEKAIQNHINAIKQADITYKQIWGKDVVKRLNRLCVENDSDMLALIHHQQDFFSTIFSKSATAAVVAGSNIPLLVIPSEME